MTFKKGHTPWNKGRKETKKEVLLRQSKGHKQIYPSKETREKMSLVRKGKTYEEMYGIETAKKVKEKRRLQMTKFNPSKMPEIRKKISLNHMDCDGEKNPRWKGGMRGYYQHIARKTLKNLGVNIKNKDVHHIDKNYKNNSIDNLIALTKREHRRIHHLKK